MAFSKLVAHNVVRGYIKDNTDIIDQYVSTVTLGSHIFYKEDK